MNNISIRQMTKKDLKEVSKYIYESFWEKFKSLAHVSEEDARAIIEVLFFSKEENYLLYYVAISNEDVVGMIKLKTSDHKDDLVVTYMKTLLKLGFLNSVKAGILLILMEKKFKKGELYIEMVAVDKKARGQGIGTNLLSFAEEKARKMKGISKVSLHVIEENSGALKLYEKIGYKKVSSKKNSLIEHLADIGKTYYMVKDL